MGAEKSCVHSLGHVACADGGCESRTSHVGDWAHEQAPLAGLCSCKSRSNLAMDVVEPLGQVADLERGRAV